MSNHANEISDLLRWWHHYQARRLNRVSDHIRNSLLQDIFTVRRQMELTCSQPKEVENAGCDRYLAHLDSLYQRLEALSSELYSPYAQDSFPLALEHTLQSWCDKLPLETHLLSDWDLQPIEQTQLLLAFTDELLGQLTNTETALGRCEITLNQQGTAKDLTYCITYQTPLPPLNLQAISASLKPFLETFRLFTQGKCEQINQPCSLRWTFCWTSLAMV